MNETGTSLITIRHESNNFTKRPLLKSIPAMNNTYTYAERYIRVPRCYTILKLPRPSIPNYPIRH